MSIINKVQNAILSLDGGKYQKFMDTYLIKKYKFSNIHPLGVQTGTDKTTKGTPDSFVEDEDGKYILIMYGSVTAIPYDKIREDILSCFNKDKLLLKKEKISKIICAYTSTNIHIEQLEKLKNLIAGIPIELIGIGTVAHDIVLKYHFLGEQFLEIPVDSGQVLDIDDFVKQYDSIGMNAPLKTELVSRGNEMIQLQEALLKNNIVVVSGASGVGKTRLVLEICRIYQTDKEYQVFCVKNNGQLLYNDIRDRIDEPQNYLIFLDDANYTMNLGSILEYCMVKQQEGISIKIIMTVRDYAKEGIKRLISEKAIYEEIVLSQLETVDIEKVIKQELGIINKIYVEQIIRIAKGNIRLAILAGMIAKEKGYLAINNAIDIFRNFYSRIFEEKKFTEKELIVLLSVAMFGPYMLDKHDSANVILKSQNITETELINICYKLHEYEILDLYENSVVKISDQSFGNYILEYTLIENKMIPIKDILLGNFPQYRSKIIYAINTLLSIFNSKDIYNYLEKQIIEAWDACDKLIEKEYVVSFRKVDEERALLYVKKLLQKEHNVNKELDVEIFLKEIENERIDNHIVEILAGFDNAENYKMAIELLICCFEKRSDLATEIYSAFVGYLDLDENKLELEFEKENYIIQRLYEKSKEDNNFGIMALAVISKFLSYDFQITKAGETPRSMIFMTYNLNYSEKLMTFRKSMWKILCDFRKHKHLKTGVDYVISNLHFREEEAKEIFLEDISILIQLFEKYMSIPDFDLCVAMGKLVQHLHWLDDSCEQLDNFLNRNDKYKIYKIISRERLRGEDWKESEEKRKKEIIEMIVNYTQEDYKKLFDICREIEVKNGNDNHQISQSINTIFEFCEYNLNLYVNVMLKYFEAQAPFGIWVNRKINVLILKIGADQSWKLLELLSEEKRKQWQVAFFEEVPKESVTKEIVEQLIRFLEKQTYDKHIMLPNVLCLEKYRYIQNDILNNVTDIILRIEEEKAYVIDRFLWHIHDQESVEKLMFLFRDNISALKQIYLWGLGVYYDHKGMLLIKLVKNDLEFWRNYIQKTKKLHKNRTSRNLFDIIWELDDYEEFINIAYAELICDNYGFYRDDYAAVIFRLDKTNESNTILRRDNWIRQCIRTNAFNRKALQIIFETISCALPEKRIYYMKILLKINSSFEIFERIPFFPSSYSWSGSEVPLIEKRINFWKELKEELNDIDYLEHLNYVKERIQYLEKHKQEVLKKEYIENFSYDS